MVLASEICKGYRHHFLALDHLREAERMMRLEKPALAAEIAKQKQAFAARGQQADWQGLAMALSLLRGADNPDSGVHPKVCQEMMRHADIETTMQLYTHTLLDDKDKAARALPDMGMVVSGGEDNTEVA